MKPQEFSSLGLSAVIQVPATIEEFELNAAGPGATAPRVGSCLAEAINNIVYRGALAVFRANMLLAVAIATGIERKKVPTGKKVKQTVVDSATGKSEEKEVDQMKFEKSEAKYFGEVCAQIDEEEEYFQLLANVVVQGVGTKDEKGNFVPSPAGLEEIARVLSAMELDFDDEKVQKIASVIGTGVIFDASQVEREEKEPKKTGKDFLAAADSIITQGQQQAIAVKLSKILGREVTFGIKDEKSGQLIPDREVLGKAIQEWDFKKRQEEKKQLVNKLSTLEV